jgi:archaellum component FlaC
MPPKVKGKINSGKKKNKRKNISPLFENSSTQSTSEHEQKEGVAQVSPEHSKRQKHTQQIVNNDRQYFTYDSPTIQNMNNTTTTTSNINNGMYLHYPNGQAMQTPQNPYPHYMPQNPTSPQPHPQQPPPWALTMMEDIKSSISNKLDTKMDKLEKMVSTMTVKLTSLEESVHGIDKRLQDVEKCSSFLSDKFDSHNKTIEETRSQVNHVDQSCQQLHEMVNTLEQSCSNINDRALDAEFQSMRDNLIFYGLSEEAVDPISTGNGIQQEGPEQNHYDRETEQCTLKVRQFIQNTLQIDATNMKFERAHRLGSNSARKPRPIIVKFHYHQDRERVRKSSFSMKDELKRQNVGVGVQIPKEWRETRQKLNPVFLSERQKGNRVKFVGNKLFINDQVYNPPQTAQ